jgi:ABC-2 type transport system ATP-binding protein
MKNVLSCRNLTKEFQKGKGAIDIGFEISAGEIVGFLGPNGAGKTTTIEMLMGLLQPEAGEVEILGHNLEQLNQFHEVYSQIGFLPSEPAYYSELTARQMFAYSRKLRGLEGFDEEIEQLAKRLNLDMDKKIEKLSLGNKRKIGTILALVGNPKLIILDEPTSGFDPLIQHEVLEILEERAKAGAAIFLSSHNLAEVESICDRVIVIKDAKLIFSGTIKEIKSKKQKRITFESKNNEQLEKIIKGTDITKDHITKYDGHVVFLTTMPEKIVERILAEKITDFTVENPTLEEMFINYYK